MGNAPQRAIGLIGRRVDSTRKCGAGLCGAEQNATVGHQAAPLSHFRRGSSCGRSEGLVEYKEGRAPDVRWRVWVPVYADESRRPPGGS